MSDHLKYLIGKEAHNTKQPIPEYTAPEPNAEQSGKVPIHSIIIDRAEGPSALCYPCYFEGETAFTDAFHCLQEWAWTAPDKGGYDKVDFILRYTDGEVYEGRFDMQHPNVPGRETSLDEHVKNFLTFEAGQRCPSHITQKQYQEFLDRRGKEWQDAAAAWLLKYQLG